MKHVVFIGADFAPSSLPPALRMRFFANHLPEFGWQPTILSTHPRHYGWPVDHQNEQLLPADLPVIRTPALPERLTRKIGIGDIGMRSMLFHWRAFARLQRRRPVDLVCIPVPPYMPMVLGRLIAMRYRIPYVIDYIDPWVTDYYWKLPPAERPPKWPLANALARICEPFALRQVGHISGVSQGTTDSVVARYDWLDQRDASEIPYGGEPGDFDYLRAHPRANPVFNKNDGCLHISYVGACIPAMYATVRALFAAIRRGLEEAPDCFAKLRLHFVGTSYTAGADGERPIEGLAHEAGIGPYVSEQPAREPYLTALQILLDSHGLVVVGSDEPHYTASKIFPYILAQRPLLAIFHEASSVVSIIRETRAGEVVTFNTQAQPAAHVPRIMAALQQMLQLPAETRPDIYWSVFAPYTTRAMAERLAGAFEQAISRV